MNKYRLGYTTGVYDIFHIGHLNLISRARGLCDRLIVGVTTDELCLEVKGKSPVIPFRDRLEIVRAIKFVDDAVAQETMDKLDAWREYGFDTMIVGDDHKGEPFWNDLEALFTPLGTDIIYLPYTKDISSSMLRKHLLTTDKAE